MWTLSQIATQLVVCANQSLCQATFAHITNHITISQLAFENFHKAKKSHTAKTKIIRKTTPLCCSSEIYHSKGLQPLISDLSHCFLSFLFLTYLFREAAFPNYLSHIQLESFKINIRLAKPPADLMEIFSVMEVYVQSCRVWDMAQRLSCHKQSHVPSHSSHTSKWINHGVMKFDRETSNRCHEMVAFKAILQETKQVLITYPV